MRPNKMMLRYRQRKFSRYKVVLAQLLWITVEFLKHLRPALKKSQINQIVRVRNQTRRQDLLLTILMRLPVNRGQLIKKALEKTRQDYCWPYLEFLCATQQDIMKHEAHEYRLKIRKNISWIKDELPRIANIEEIAPELLRSGIITNRVRGRSNPWKQVLDDISCQENPRLAMEALLAFCQPSSIAQTILKTCVSEDGAVVQDGTMHLELQLYQEKAGRKSVGAFPVQLYGTIARSIMEDVGKKYGLGLIGSDQDSSGIYQLTLGKLSGYRPSSFRRALRHGFALDMEKEIRKKNKNWSEEFFQVIIDVDLNQVDGKSCLEGAYRIQAPLHEYDEGEINLESFVNNYHVMMGPPLYTLKEIAKAIAMLHGNTFKNSAEDIRFMIQPRRDTLYMLQGNYEDGYKRIVRECVMANRSDVMEVLFQCGLFYGENLRMALKAIRLCMGMQFTEMEATLRRLYRLEISYTDLHKAARLGIREIAEKFLRKNPDLILEEAYDGSSPFDCAIESGDIDTVKLFAPCQNRHLIFPARNIEGFEIITKARKAENLGFFHIANYLKSLFQA